MANPNNIAKRRVSMQKNFLIQHLNTKIKEHKYDISPKSFISPIFCVVNMAALVRILSVPLRSYKNFILFTHKYKNCVRYVKCDSLIIYGLNDEIVPKRVVDGAYELLASNNKVYIEYEKVGHVVFQSKRKDEINKDIYNFLIGGKKWTCKKKRKK